jgi:nitrogen fixation NifU-like protein
MSADMYQERLLDHARNPRHRSVPGPADYSAEDAGSVCGDEIRIDLRVSGDRVAEVAFSGRGRAVSQASASVLTELVATMALDDARAQAEDDLLAAIGVSIGPARLECALLGLKALKAGLSGVPPTEDSR